MRHAHGSDAGLRGLPPRGLSPCDLQLTAEWVVVLLLASAPSHSHAELRWCFSEEVLSMIFHLEWYLLLIYFLFIEFIGATPVHEIIRVSGAGVKEGAGPGALS